MIDLAALRALKACDACRPLMDGKNLGWLAIHNVRSCDSCLNLIVAEVMEQAARIADRHDCDRNRDCYREIAAAIREAAQESRDHVTKGDQK